MLFLPGKSTVKGTYTVSETQLFSMFSF